MVVETLASEMVIKVGKIILFFWLGLNCPNYSTYNPKTKHQANNNKKKRLYISKNLSDVSGSRGNIITRKSKERG